MPPHYPVSLECGSLLLFPSQVTRAIKLFSKGKRLRQMPPPQFPQVPDMDVINGINKQAHQRSSVCCEQGQVILIKVLSQNFLKYGELALSVLIKCYKWRTNLYLTRHLLDVSQLRIDLSKNKKVESYSCPISLQLSNSNKSFSLIKVINLVYVSRHYTFC